MPANRRHRPSFEGRARLQVVGEIGGEQVVDGARNEGAHEIGNVGVIGLDGSLGLPRPLQPRREAVDGIVVWLELGFR